MGCIFDTGQFFAAGVFTVLCAGVRGGIRPAAVENAAVGLAGVWVHDIGRVFALVRR